MNLIHIIENLDKGAVENWLVNIFLESRKLRPTWKWTFYCILGKPGRLDDLVTSAGGIIIYSPVSLSEKGAFLFHLRKTLREGKYDLLHMHHDYMSGFYLLATIGLPLTRKIVHVHNNDREIPVGNQILRSILLKLFRRINFALADDVVGISSNTLQEFKNDFQGRKPIFSLLYYGIMMERFEGPVDPAEFRRKLQVPLDAKVLLFIGRMNKEKNPVYIVDILHSMLQKRDDVYAVFVGKGEQEALIHERAETYHITDHIRIMGWSDNVVNCLKSADVFVFPRLLLPREGLGLVVVEAQCAGLPIFMTHGIVEDAIILQELAFFEELKNPAVWGDHIERVLNIGNRTTRENALQRMKASRFELSHAAMNFIELYERRPLPQNINVSL